MTGVADGKEVTLSAVIGSTLDNVYFASGNTSTTMLQLYCGNNNRLGVIAYDTSGSVAINFLCASVIYDSVNYNISISFNMAAANSLRVIINGTQATPTVSTFVVDSVLNLTEVYRVGKRYDSSYYWSGTIGELYFNNTYTDLATDNPFWDSDANRPNSVRKVIADTGVTPLIALPLMGNDAGNNLGSGGDFTVNSGPYAGARGGSEFWARSVFASGSSYLRNTSLSAADGKNVTFVCAYKVSNNSGVIQFENGSSSQRMKIFFGGDGGFDLEMMNSSGGNVLRAIASNVNVSVGDWCTLMLSVDLTNSSNRSLYVNGSVPTANFATYSNTDIAFSEMLQNDIFKGNGGFLPFDLGAMYFNNSYIDFSQEANRYKFFDQLGYPRDLTQQIEDGDIPNPLIYMKFDPSSLGTNSGTGGNFTAYGTVVAGSDVDPRKFT